MTPKEFEDVIIIARKYGIERFKINACEVHFAHIPAASSLVSDQERQPTEDELLFHSSIPMTDDELKAHAPA